MTLYRFTFNHGSYDVGQAVVAADSLEEAHSKLTATCADLPRDQGYSTQFKEWSMDNLVTHDPNGQGEEPRAINGDVVFTHGVDG
jgi:hypothetical protein